MIDLRIKGNKFSYQLTNNVEYVNISLSGDFDNNKESKINLIYDNDIQHFDNRSILLEFSEKIKGMSFDKFILTFVRYKFSESFIENIENKSSIEIGLLKAIFLIYYRINLLILISSYNDLEKQLSNEFVVDFTNKPEPQNDIYFIDKRHITTNNKLRLKKLVDLNLLASFEISSINFNFSTYFIPLIKPGVSRDNFTAEFDPNGDNTYNFWKTILNDRDIRVNRWYNNRF